MNWYNLPPDRMQWEEHYFSDIPDKNKWPESKHEDILEKLKFETLYKTTSLYYSKWPRPRKLRKDWRTILYWKRKRDVKAK